MNPNSITKLRLQDNSRGKWAEPLAHRCGEARVKGLVCLILISLAAAHGLSQDGPADTRDHELATRFALPVDAADGTSARVPSSANANDDSPFREQTIYVPFNKLREVFEKPGRGVFVPYERFRALWELAREKLPRPTDDRPPIGVLIQEVDSQASVKEDVVLVSAQLRVEVLGEGWHKAPLRLRDSAIRSARVDGHPARVLFDPTSGYQLIVHNDDGEPVEIEVELEYAKAFQKSPAKNSVSFQSPAAPVNRWRIRVPQPGVQLDIHPLIAASESLGEDSPPAGEEETVLTAFVGATPQVRIEWTPKAEGATGLKALSTVQSVQQVSIDQGVVRSQCQLRYEISRAELAELEIQVPGDQRVTGVFDPNVRQWQVRGEGDVQIISVQLFQPARGNQQLTVQLEKFIDSAEQELSVLPIQAVGVGRQHGMLVVRSTEELRVEVMANQGLSQLDKADLPTGLQRGNWNHAYRFSAVPFRFDMRLERVTPRLHVDQLVEAYVQPEQIVVEVLAVVDVQRAGIFELQVSVPAEYEVRSVRGHALENAEAAAVDSFHRDPDRPELVTVDFARKAIGRVGLVLELHRPLQETGLRDATAAAASLNFSVPRIVTASETNKGRLVVSAPESLRITPRQRTGLRDISFEDAYAELASLRGDRFPNTRPMLGYRYQSDPATLEFDAQLRKPQVSVRQLLSARVKPGVIVYEATFSYEIRFSGVRELRIDVPVQHSREIRNVTPSVREAVMQPQPEDVEEGFEAWSFSGETEFLGNRQVRLQWEQESEELEVGSSFDFQVPQLRPKSVDRAWGQIVLSKAESLDVQPMRQAAGLRPIDPQHDLMAGAAISDAARAFEFHEDWELTVRAKRYQLEDIKRTSIERGLVRMVVTRSGQTSVQALYRMRSVAQNIAVQLPGDVEFDADPLRVNGQVQPLKRGEDGQLFIPIGDATDDAFLLELRYTAPGDHRRLDLPVFPAQAPVQSEPAIQKVVLAVYLPDDTVRLGSRGPWTADRTSTLFGMRRHSNDISELIRWVSEGVSLHSNQLQGFPTSGQLFTYSALRPAPPPDGSLRIVAFSKRGLDALLLGGFGLLGIALVRQSLTTKLMFLLLMIGAVVAAGVFTPTFATLLVSSKMLVAFGVVLLVWCIAMVFMFRNWSSLLTTTSAAAVGSLAANVSDEPAFKAPAPEIDGDDAEKSSDIQHGGEQNAD